MSTEIGLFEAMYTQRAIRRFRPDPVPDALVRRLLEAATRAPSGADRQPWRFIVIRDEATKRAIARHYRAVFETHYGQHATSPRGMRVQVRADSAYLAEHIQEAPVFIMACVEHEGDSGGVERGASIYPAVQNLLLAALALGLGAVLTTNHKGFEADVKALLGIPENVETAALIPVGYPAEGARYGPTRRRPVEDVTFWEQWGAPPP